MSDDKPKNPSESKELALRTQKSYMPSKKFHVIMIDDDKELSRLVTLILAEKSVTVATCTNGVVALQLINEKRPDMIILDIMMPGTDGQLILQSFKNSPHLVNIPVLMLSARVLEEDVLRAMHTGAVDYIKKPFDPEDLLNRALRLLEAGPHKGKK